MESPGGTSLSGYPISLEYEEFDVYPLEPVCGAPLCVWAEEAGIIGLTTSEVWDTDEWLGHVPVSCLADPRRTFTFLDNIKVRDIGDDDLT
jgi:hypothetical protein